MKFHVRRATLADGEGVIETLRRSIAELCIPDHGGDAGKIELWLANKTVENWARWIAQDDVIGLVAEREGRIIGVGMANLQGEIRLNYVHPEARFAGVSSALLATLETDLRACNLWDCRLESTITARPFYEGRGYREVRGNATTLAKSL